MSWSVYISSVGSFDPGTHGVNSMQMNWLQGSLLMPVSYPCFPLRPENYLAEFQGLLFLTCKMVITVMSSVEREMASQDATVACWKEHEHELWYLEDLG